MEVKMDLYLYIYHTEGIDQLFVAKDGKEASECVENKTIRKKMKWHFATADGSGPTGLLRVLTVSDPQGNEYEIKLVPK